MKTLRMDLLRTLTKDENGYHIYAVVRCTKAVALGRGLCQSYFASAVAGAMTLSMERDH
jgi:hypothetical protein